MFEETLLSRDAARSEGMVSTVTSFMSIVELPRSLLSLSEINQEKTVDAEMKGTEIILEAFVFGVVNSETGKGYCKW